MTWAFDNEDDPASRLLLRTSARGALVPVLAVAATEDRVYLAAPSGAVGATRFRPRAGPLFRRFVTEATLIGDEGLDPFDEDGAPIRVPIDVIEASRRVLDSCQVTELAPFLEEYPQAWPASTELADFVAGAVLGLGAALGPLPVEEGLGGAAAGGAAAVAGPLVGAAPPGDATPRRQVQPPTPGPAPAPAAPAAPPAAGLHPEFISQLLQLQASFFVPTGQEAPAAPVAPVPCLAGPALGLPLAAPPASAPGGAAAAPRAAGAPPGLAARPKPAGAVAAGAAAAPLPAPAMQSLDPAVVASARAAGISEADLSVFDRAVGAGSRRMNEPAVARPPPVLVDGLEEAAPGGDKLDRLIDALTAAFNPGGSASSAGPADPVERALSALDGGQRVGEPVGARRGAAARLALRRALLENPEHFTKYVNGQLANAFTSRAAAGERPTMREYLELRSRIGNHRPTISWAWCVAGARDALAAGRTAEALARLDLALIAGEQTSIDGGSWLLAQELLWEEDPPFSAFSGRRPADSNRAATSHLCDPRWAEAALSRLKEVDEWNERRRRLAQAPPPPKYGAEGQGGGGMDGEQQGGRGAPVKPPPRRPRKQDAAAAPAEG